MHTCDRQTDREAGRRTDRITTPKTALAYARAVKIVAYTLNRIKSDKTNRDGVQTVCRDNAR